METPSEVDTTVGNEVVENEPDDMVLNSTQACSNFGALWSDEELGAPQPRRTIPVRPGHLWCGGEADAAETSSKSDADYEHPADEDDTLATLKKQYLEILDRLDRLHDSLDILTRMSFRSESIPKPIDPKRIEQVLSMKAEVGSMSVGLSPSSRSDDSPAQPKKDRKTPPVASGFRPSFTPNLFSSFEQFDMSLKRVAARADSAHRKRKYASVRQKDALNGARQGCLERIVKHSGFDFFFAFVVLSNSIFIGVEVQLGLEIQGSRPLAIYTFQYAYTFLFSVELGLRLLADWRFYLCDEWMWTWLDIFIVLSSLWELAVDLIYVWSGREAAEPERFAGVINLKALRVIRVTRIVKAVRLMRIFRFVMALRTLITSIIHTLQSLFWALALLVLIVYVFAVLFVQAVQDHILDPDNPALPEREMLASQRYFSSLPDTMLSLFMCIAGGASWEDVQAPLKAISTVWVFFFLFFVSFTYFAVLNVVTGVFCQSAIDSAQNDHATVVQSILANKEMHIQKIRTLFNRFDQQETGVITFAMLEEKLDSSEVREYFETLGLDVWDAWTFFKLLDLDAGGAISIEEFLMGCLRLRGPARAIDVEKIIYDQSWLIRSQGKFHTYMEAEMVNVIQHLQLLTGMHLTKSDSLKMSESPENSQELSAWSPRT